MVQHTVVGNTAGGGVSQQQAGGVVVGWGRNHGGPNDGKLALLDDREKRTCAIYHSLPLGGG